MMAGVQREPIDDLRYGLIKRRGVVAPELYKWVAEMTAKIWPIVTIKLSKAEWLVDEQLLAMAEWALVRPTKWHDIGKLEATQKTAHQLAKGGGA